VESAVEGAHRTGPEATDEVEATPAERIVGSAAALSIAASMIHASVIVPHFREYFLFGVFFVVSAVFQLVWGMLAWNRRNDRTLLTIGAVANLAIVVLWVATRTVGLPIGPEPGEVEPAGLHDLLATADEIAIAIACGLAMAPGLRWKGALTIPFWVFAIASGILAFPGPHSA
jgi:hypothetical protein